MTAPPMPMHVRSRSLLTFLSGAPSAISRLRELVCAIQAETNSSCDDIPRSSTSASTPGSSAEPQQTFSAQNHAIGVFEEMYLRIKFVLQLQKIESSPSDREVQAEMEEAAITSWPHMILDTFISSLEPEKSLDAPQGVSFIILAHLYLLLTLLDDLWFLGENFDIEITKVNALVVSLDNEVLSKAMEWPMNVIGLSKEGSL